MWHLVHGLSPLLAATPSSAASGSDEGAGFLQCAHFLASGCELEVQASLELGDEVVSVDVVS